MAHLGHIRNHCVNNRESSLDAGSRNARSRNNATDELFTFVCFIFFLFIGYYEIPILCIYGVFRRISNMLMCAMFSNYFIHLIHAHYVHSKCDISHEHATAPRIQLKRVALVCFARSRENSRVHKVQVPLIERFSILFSLCISMNIEHSSEFYNSIHSANTSFAIHLMPHAYVIGCV